MAQTKIKGVIMPVDATAFLVRVNPQPTVNGDFFSFRKFIFKQDGFSEKLLDFSPYQPGDKIYVKEGITHNVLCHAIYKSDSALVNIGQPNGQYVHIDDIDNSGRGFISAYHMPLSAARHFKDVVKVEAVRLKDMTGQQAQMIVQTESDGFFKDYIKPLRKRHLYATQSLKSYIIYRFAQHYWDNNEYFWLVTVKTAEK